MFSGSGVSKSKLFDYDGSAQSQRAFISPELFSKRCPFCVCVCCLPSDSLQGDPQALQFLPCFGFRPPATQSIQERQRWKKSKKSRNTVLFPMFSGSGVSKSKLFDITTEVRKANARLFHPNYSVRGVRFACASAVFPATRSRVIRKDCNSYASGFARPPIHPREAKVIEGSLEAKIRTHAATIVWRAREERIAKQCVVSNVFSYGKVDKAGIKKCTRLWHQAHVEVKILKALQVRWTFGSCVWTLSFYEFAHMKSRKKNAP